MSRTIVRLHTISQWMELDPAIRSVVLQNIRLKDRLHQFITKRNAAPSGSLKEPKWVPCRSCEKRGWILKQPRYPGIHPSQLGGPCLLRIYNEMIGAPGQEKIEPRLQLIFDLGHAVHDMFQTYGEQGAWGASYKREVEISEDYQKLSAELMLEGHADAENLLIIDDVPNAPIYEVGLVHEYKTIGSNGFEKLSRPKPEHLDQATIYSAALDRPVVVYLYMNKNDQTLKDFPIPFDQINWNRIRSKIVLLKDHFNSSVPPKGDTGFHCQGCAYVFSCPDYAELQKGIKKWQP